MSQINFYNVDCMDFMRDKPDNFYKLAIVDPPYGIGISRAGGYYHVKGKGQTNPHTKKDWDIGIPNAEYWQKLFIVSKNQIVWGGNYMTEFLPPSRCWIFWDKMKFVDNYADGELAWTSFDRNTKKVEIQHHGFLTKDGKSIHPTQKPVQLYRWLLQNYAKPGDNILDTHGGSMSSAIACDMEGYDLDICELDKEYFDAGVKRFQNYKLQGKLF